MATVAALAAAGIVVDESGTAEETALGAAVADLASRLAAAERDAEVLQGDLHAVREAKSDLEVDLAVARESAANAEASLQGNPSVSVLVCSEVIRVISLRLFRVF